ncbi:hypothetical protein [Petrotoga sp. 9PW.55.5.1]
MKEMKKQIEIIKGMKPEKSVKRYPRFETLEGLHAQVDWKEDIKL